MMKYGLQDLKKAQLHIMQCLLEWGLIRSIMAIIIIKKLLKMKIPIIKENETREDFFKRGIAELKIQGVNGDLSQHLIKSIWNGNEKLKQSILTKINSTDILK